MLRIFSILVLLLYCKHVSAQGGSEERSNDRVTHLQEQLQLLDRTNNELQAQINNLKNSTDKFWPGEWLTFQSTTPGCTGHYLSHSNELGFIVSFNDANDDFRWRLVPGLAHKDCYSIESKSYPGRYLRHQGYRIKLHLDDGSDLFKKDATWMVRQPSTGQVRFESFNLIGHFLRHYNSELWLGSGNGVGFHSARLFLEDSIYNVRVHEEQDETDDVTVV